MTKAKAAPAQKRKPAPGKGKTTKAKTTKPKTVAKTAPAPIVFAKTMAETTAPKQPKPRGPGIPFEKGQSGNPAGRPKGARHKLSQDFIRVLAEDFAEHGVSVIAKLRDDNPAAYAKTIAGVLPKIIELEDEDDDSGGKPITGALLVTRDFIRGLCEEHA